MWELEGKSLWAATVFVYSMNHSLAPAPEAKIYPVARTVRSLEHPGRCLLKKSSGTDVKPEIEGKYRYQKDHFVARRTIPYQLKPLLPKQCLCL